LISVITEGRGMYIFSLVANIVAGLAIGLLPIVDNFSHIGGFVCGFLMGNILLCNTMCDEYGKPLLPWYARLLSCVSVITLVVWFALGFIFLYTSEDARNWCPSCSYASWIDTKWWDCVCYAQDSNGNAVETPC
jgi:hypothetical protein